MGTVFRGVALVLGAGVIVAGYTRQGAARHRATEPFPAPTPSLRSIAAPVQKTLFGLHIHFLHRQPPTPWPTAPFGAWRLHDVTGAKWFQLESASGVPDFRLLDRYVELGASHGVELLLTLGQTPGWAASNGSASVGADKGDFRAQPPRLSAWHDYVQAVATRYKGKIPAYEIWNEPNLKMFYDGTPEQLVELTREASQVLKTVDPAVVVVSPSFTAIYGLPALEKFLKAGGGKYVDVIAYHFYGRAYGGSPEENIPPIVKGIRDLQAKYGLSDKPIWNTETGYCIENPAKPTDPDKLNSFHCSQLLPVDRAAAYLARSYILSAWLGVDRLYWYGWDNDVMGLTELDHKTVKAPGIAYGVVYGWLVGATVQDCAPDESGVWSCGLTRGGGTAGHLVWSVGGPAKFALPPEWKARKVSALDGHSTPIGAAAGQLAVTEQPQLVE
jgi:hypothetical protein